MRHLLRWFWWIVAGALIVLLVFSSWTRVLFDAPIRFLSAYTIGPLYRAFARPALSEEAYNEAKLRAALQAFLGEKYSVQDLATREQHEAQIRTWAEERRFPAPILAAVVTQYEERGQRQFVIDRGTQDGIREGSAVVLGKGVLVGRVVRAAPSRSVVRLLTARNHAFSVRLDTVEQVAGVMKGKGEAESLIVEFVPRERTIQPHAVVLTSGLDDLVPQGLLAGVVEEIRASESGPWQTLLVTPLVRPSDLLVVGVLSYAP